MSDTQRNGYGDVVAIVETSTGGSPGAETPPPLRKVRPHTPGPGYICHACERPHIPGCSSEQRIDGEVCPNRPGVETPPPDDIQPIRTVHCDNCGREVRWLNERPSVCAICGWSLAMCSPAAPPPSVSQEGGTRNTRDARELLAPLLEQVKIHAQRLEMHAGRNVNMGAATEARAGMIAAGEKIIEAYADALLTARYQSDVSRQADDAREKAEQERDRVIATAADTIFTTTQTWVEKLASIQAEKAGLQADKERLDWMDGASRVELQTVTSSLDAIRIAVDAARPSPTT
jgi:hypothetical protein